MIGVLGATGAVGRAAAHELARRGAELRVGGRDGARLRALAAKLPAEPALVDIEDADALAAFAAGCRVVVNCAGPSQKIGARVLDAASASGAAYVDAAGGMLEGTRGRALVEAGMMPGLSALLPRWLCERTPGAPLRLTGFVGGADRFTPAAAADYVATLRDGSGLPLAAWRARTVVERALTPLTHVELTFFPRRVNAHPFLSTEAIRLAHALELRDLECYGVFDGARTLEAIRRLRPQDEPSQAAPRLVEASELDLFGRSPYQLLVFSLETDETSATAALRAVDSYRLSGAFAALAALAERIPEGVHRAGETLDPSTTIEALRSTAAVESLELVEAPAEHAVEEGVL